MLCINCGEEIDEGEKKCPECGYSAIISSNAVVISGRLYNKGLKMAKSGRLYEAEMLLSRSVKANKRNIYARNLLGLVYLKTGRVADASKQWVISANIDRITGNKERENSAVSYLKDIEDNTAEYETLAQAVGFYNNAVEYIKKGANDLAIVRLKRAVKINNSFIKAWELLALCCLKQGDKKNAALACEEILKTDVSNPNALRYQRYALGSTVSRKPDKNTVLNNIEKLFIFAAGAAACLIIMVSFVLPRIDKASTQRYDELSDNYMQLQEKYNQYKQSADNQIDELNTQKQELNTQVEQNNTSNQLLKAKELFDKASYCETADILLEVDENSLDESSRQIYNEIYAQTMEKASWQKYTDGKNSFENGDYEKAAQLLEESIKYAEDIDVTKYTAMYQLGKTALELGDDVKAKDCFTQVSNNHPDDAMKGYAKEYLESE